ncbi:unnamed protein product [Lymnaea stagnalis]|uniref:NADH dehydrogenase [ubiquinone] 1 beta subcomplex subunit 11, mitochondrial n=1 Tax=Lymnaea stagnalis TaxID=6523 RepID=A0AAV2I7K4_LYMST
MATLLRSVARQGRVFQVISKNKPARIIVVPLLKHNAYISTSEKKKDVGAVVQTMEKSAELKRLTEHFKDTDTNKEENYISYGYEPGDRDTDYFLHHLVMFCSITICVCLGGFILAYMPDYKFHDWCKREAFLELERREREGLPLVDPDYACAESIKLPTDEEIGNVEIII